MPVKSIEFIFTMHDKILTICSSIVLTKQDATVNTKIPKTPKPIGGKKR